MVDLYFTWHQVSFHCFPRTLLSQQLSSQGDITYPLDLYARESCCFCGWVGVCPAFWTLLLVEMGRPRCQVPTPNSWSSQTALSSL